MMHIRAETPVDRAEIEQILEASCDVKFNNLEEQVRQREGALLAIAPPSFFRSPQITAVAFNAIVFLLGEIRT